MTGYPSAIKLVGQQTRYQLRSFVRVPVALFFTVILPLVMLVLFNALFGDGQVDTGVGRWPVRQFYTGGLAAYTAVGATYSNLGNMVPIRRDEGVLKRWKSTPLPTWAYISGLIGSAVVIAALSVLLTLTIGVVFYGLEVEAAKMPAAIVTFLVGVFAFASLGMALVSLIKTASASAAMVNATILPLAFISDVFIATDSDSALSKVANFFPLKPFVNAFQDCFNPLVDSPAFAPGKLAFVAAWGIVGLVFALARFSWEPSGAPSRRGRRSREAAADAA